MKIPRDNHRYQTGKDFIMSERTMQKHERALELDKILNLLAQETACDDAAKLAVSVRPTPVWKKWSSCSMKRTKLMCCRRVSAPRRSAD